MTRVAAHTSKSSRSEGPAVPGLRHFPTCPRIAQIGSEGHWPQGIADGLFCAPATAPCPHLMRSGHKILLKKNRPNSHRTWACACATAPLSWHGRPAHAPFQRNRHKRKVPDKPKRARIMVTRNGCGGLGHPETTFGIVGPTIPQFVSSLPEDRIDFLRLKFAGNEPRGTVPMVCKSPAQTVHRSGWLRVSHTSTS